MSRPRCTRVNSPWFPIIFRLEVQLEGESCADCLGFPSAANPGQYQEMRHPLGDGAAVVMQYQLHAYNKRQQEEHVTAMRLLAFVSLAAAGTILAASWLYFAQRRDQERRRQGTLARQQLHEAERLRLAGGAAPPGGRATPRRKPNANYWNNSWQRRRPEQEPWS